MIMSGSPAFLTETAHEALQDYHHDPHQHHHHGGVTYVDAAPNYSSNKTIDLIGEEFVKKALSHAMARDGSSCDTSSNAAFNPADMFRMRIALSAFKAV